MHIIDIIKQQDEELLRQYLVDCNKVNVITMEDIDYIINSGKRYIFLNTNISMSYLCKIKILKECNMRLFREHDYIDMLNDGIDELSFMTYVSQNIVSTNILFRCFQLGYEKFILQQLTKYRFELTITDEDMIEFGIFIVKNGHKVTFKDVSIPTFRRLVCNNIINNIDDTKLCLDITKLDDIISVIDKKDIMKILWYIDINEDILQYICNMYPNYISNLDGYVSYETVTKCNTDVLSYFSYLYVIRLYDQYPRDDILLHIRSRKDINKLTLHINSKRFYNSINLLENINDKTIELVLLDKYNECQYLDLYKTLRRGKYKINIGTESVPIQNILLKLELSDELYTYRRYDYDVDDKTIKYCCRLFRTGLERFYNKYVINGPKLLQYYYHKHMNINNNLLYTRYNTDISIINIV